VNRPQWITVFAGICFVVLLYLFGRTVPVKKSSIQAQSAKGVTSLSTDSILAQSKTRLSTDQAIRVNELENSISRGDVRNQQLQVYHQLAHFWSDTARIFEPYAWYEGESARLENSEKSLTFAAHLFLDNLRAEDNPALRTWKALQAKDLFERSLKINPRNDSSQVGLGACYIFGNISETPMEGILKIREVVERDSTNVYAQMMLGNGSMLSGQYDKAIIRFETVLRLQPTNLEAMLILAEAYERKGEKQPAIQWYQKSLPLIKMDEVRKEVENRINELKK